MKASGVVIEKSGQYVKVKSKRTSACASCKDCEAKGACHAELIFGSNNSEVIVEAKNDVGANVGDRVELISKSEHALFVAAMIFVVPFLLSVALYFVFDLFVSSMALKAMLLIISYFLCFCVITKVMNVYVMKNFVIRAARILKGDGPNESE